MGGLQHVAVGDRGPQPFAGIHQLVALDQVEQRSLPVACERVLGAEVIDRKRRSVNEPRARHGAIGLPARTSWQQPALTKSYSCAGDLRISDTHQTSCRLKMPSPASLHSDRGTGPQDLQLVRRAVAGDALAIEGVLGRLSCVVKFVYRLHRTLGYQLEAAALEDVVQQVYAAVWPRLPDYAGTAALESWVYGFCRNCLRAEARRRNRTERTTAREFDQLARDTSGPGGVLADAEQLDELRGALEQLPCNEREVVIARHLDGCSFEQIARQQSLSASTVKDRCYRAMLKLKNTLERRDVTA